MAETNSQNRIYVVVSQTGTSTSRFLKAVTKKRYNHISLSLDASLEKMYSFGRRLAYFMFWAGFIEESVKKGVFKRFRHANILVLEIEVTESQYRDIKALMEEMLAKKYKYTYNYKGLFFAAFDKYKKYDNKFYCSEFAKYVFKKFKINGYEIIDEIAHPDDFRKIPSKVIYSGMARDYENFIAKRG